MDELSLELNKSLRTHDERYDYFLLAVAGASIAFALNQTKGLALAWSQIPLGIAGACWAASFFTGCLRLKRVRHAMLINARMIDMQGKVQSIQGGPEYVRQIATEAFDKKDNAAVAFGMWQFTLLVTGALFYIAWHIIEMYLKVKH